MGGFNQTRYPQCLYIFFVDRATILTYVNSNTLCGSDVHTPRRCLCAGTSYYPLQDQILPPIVFKTTRRPHPSLNRLNPTSGR